MNHLAVERKVAASTQNQALSELYRWGLIPGWAKDPAIGNKLANARGETVAEKQLLKPCPAAAMAAHRVSPRVNTAKHDDPALIEPFESAT